ncbi:MAG: Na+/proline symporter [Halioglobus sp.]|jgi:Na+/proline symporter
MRFRFALQYSTATVAVLPSLSARRLSFGGVGYTDCRRFTLTREGKFIDTYIVVTVISMAIFIFVGTYTGRKVKALDDYFVAGRRAPTFLIMGTLVASVFSTTIFLGEAGFTYDGQMGPYILLPGIAVAGYVYGALLFGTFLRRSRASTVAEFLGRRFNSRRVQRAAGYTIVVGLGGYLLVVTQGAALLLADLTGLSYQQSLLAAWLSYTFFTMYSGSQGVIITDTLMFLLFGVASVVFVIFLVDGLGGLTHSIEALTRSNVKQDITTWHGTVGPGTSWDTPMDFLIWVVVVDMCWGVVYAVGPWQASRHLMARDEHVVLRSAIYACFAVIVMQMLIYGAGGLINLANPDITPSETVIIWAAKTLVPEILGALLLAGIMAAALSSASTFLSLVGFSVSNDIPASHGAISLSRTRIIMFFTGTTVLIVSYFVPPNVFWITLFIGTVFASSWGPVGFMSIWSSRITADAAFWGIVAGFFGNVVPAALVYIGWINLPSYLDPAVLGVVASVLTIVLISRRGEVSAEERDYRRRLHHTPTEDRSLQKTRLTLVAPLLLALYGLMMPMALLRWYVTPYQAGAGQLLADGSINWSGAEAWFALSPAALFIPLGLISTVVIWRRYRPLDQ